MDFDDILDEGGGEGGGEGGAGPSRRPSRFAPKGAKPIPKATPAVFVKEEEDSKPSLCETADHMDCAPPLPCVNGASAAANSDAVTKLEESIQEPMDEEVNAIVCEFDVYFIPPPLDDNTQLYVLQYPLRPSWQPYELEERCKEVRVKANSAEVQVDLEIDVSSDNYDPEQATAGMAVNKQTLASSWSPSQRSSYAVGVLSGRKLYLNPVHAVVQLRPSMEYLNSVGSMKRGIIENFVKSEESPGESSSRQSRKQPKQSAVDAAEPWISLKYHARSANVSIAYLRKMLEEANTPIQFSINAIDYVSSLCPGAISNKNRKSPFIRSYLSLPLEERFKKYLAEGPPANRFATLKHLALDESDEDVLAILQEYALLVQGLWVLKSSTRHGPDDKQMARDYALLLFHHSPIVKKKQLEDLGNKKPTVIEFLKEFAVERGEKLQDWKFREPTDVSFLKSHPEIVREQEQVWQHRETLLLRTRFVGKNRSRPQAL
ncbi:hypothetical protein Dimus_034477 [Dionaea muscipula]